MNRIKFDDLPNEVGQIREDLKSLTELIRTLSPSRNFEKPLNIIEVSQLTGLSKQTLYKYCQNREIPFHKTGGRNFFFYEDIIDWIRKGKVKTIWELQRDTDNLISNGFEIEK